MLQPIKELLKKQSVVNTYLHKNQIRKQFETERLLIKNKHVASSNHVSILHFTFNKAASQYIRDVLKKVALSNGMHYAGLLEYAFHTKFPYLYWFSEEQMQNYKHIFKEKGYLYSAISEMIRGIDHLDRYKIIYMVRDPRDMLVSTYYSIAYSHAVPGQAKANSFLHHRKQALDYNIDEYVIEKAPGLLKNFNKYDKYLVQPLGDIHITRYEDMTADFPNWLRKLLEYCELETSNELFNELIAEHRQNQPKKEDKKQHVRKGQPGDYKEKLQPKTIQVLNEQFAPILDSLGYAR